MNKQEQAEEHYIDQINRFAGCYIVKAEHYEAVKHFCDIMVEHRVLRIAFFCGQETHAQQFSICFKDYERARRK
jgi:hypothetical protein